MGRGRGQIVFYNCTQLGHLERDYHNPYTTCSYYNSFYHLIEDYPILLAKLQEIQGGNQQVQVILAEPCGEEPRVSIITRGGAVIREDMETPGKTIDGSGIIRASERAPFFDPRK
jgi:hypothetical protein